MTELKGKHVDVSPLLRAAGFDTGPVEILETPGMYPYKEKIEDNWAYFTAVGSQELRRIFEREELNTSIIGIVGICSGVEGIAVAETFQPELKELIVTDVDEEILKGTCINLANATNSYDVRVVPLVGSFCEPIAEKGLKVDFVHANIPNLPASESMDLSLGAEKGTFLLRDLYEKYQPPDKFVAWALGAQWAYLKSAIEVLNPGGSVITELGGRVPLSIIEDLFRELSLQFSEVLVGYKEQTEALIDFQGYSAFEREFGVEFEFYLHEPSLETLNQLDLRTPSARIFAREMKEALAPYKVSSEKALKLHHEGVPVGHTVHIFRGKLPSVV